MLGVPCQGILAAGSIYANIKHGERPAEANVTWGMNVEGELQCQVVKVAEQRQEDRAQRPALVWDHDVHPKEDAVGMVDQHIEAAAHRMSPHS